MFISKLNEKKKNSESGINLSTNVCEPTVYEAKRDHEENTQVLYNLKNYYYGQ